MKNLKTSATGAQKRGASKTLHSRNTSNNKKGMMGGLGAKMAVGLKEDIND